MDERLGNIKRQVEFYFGDSNLPRDRFLREQIAGDKDGFVKIEVLCKFKRMQDYKATVEDIVKLFEGSTFIGVSEDKTGIKRLTPLPSIDDSNSRKLHVSKFPKEVTQIELELFFDQLEPNGIASVRMVRTKFRQEPNQPKPFVGSVFVEFKTAENMNSVLKRVDDVKYKESKLEIRTFDDYIRYQEENKKKRKEDRKRKRSEEMFTEKMKEVKEVYSGCLIKIKEIPTEPKMDFKELKGKLMETLGIRNFFVEYPYKDVAEVAVVRFEQKGVADKFKADVGSGEVKLFGEKDTVLEELNEEEADDFFKTLAEKLLKDDHEPANKKRKLV